MSFFPNIAKYTEIMSFKEKAFVGNSLIVTGVAINQEKDMDGEMNVITPNQHKKALEVFKKNPVCVVDHRKNSDYFSKVIGKVIDMTYSPENLDLDVEGVPEYEIIATVEVTDPNAIQDIITGKFRGFSLNWRYIKNNLLVANSGYNLSVSGVVYDELSVCAVPKNPTALFTKIDTVNAPKYDFAFQVGDEIMIPNTMEAKVKACYLDESLNKYYELEKIGSKQKAITNQKVLVVEQSLLPKTTIRGFFP